MKGDVLLKNNGKIKYLELLVWGHGKARIAR